MKQDKIRALSVMSVSDVVTGFPAFVDLPILGYSRNLVSVRLPDIDNLTNFK